MNSYIQFVKGLIMKFLLVGFIMSLMTVFSANAQDIRGLKEGVDFRYVDVGNNGVVKDNKEPVVVEFFWYGCPHCFRMKPFMTQFKERNKDVKVVNYPVVFGGWENGAKIHFTLEELEMSTKYHAAIFANIHINGIRLHQNETAFFSFMERNKEDVNKVKSIYNSFSVASKIAKARTVTKAYDLNGTPSLAVHRNGKVLLVEPPKLGSFERTMEVLEILTRK